MEPRGLYNRYRGYLRECGIGEHTFHALRHTFATRCIENGFDAKSLSEILGHASVNITLQRYVHSSLELKRTHSTLENPDNNATGTSNAIPVSDIFGLADELTPGIGKYGILYTSGEVNSVNTAKNAKEYLDSKGIAYEEIVVTNSSEVQQAAQQLSSECDAIFVPNDSVIQSAMPAVAQAAKDAKIPVYGSSAVMVNDGAFATIAISDTQIGAISADMAYEILAEGKTPADIPAQVVGATDTVINKTTMEAIGVTVDAADGITFVEN